MYMIICLWSHFAFLKLAMLSTSMIMLFFWPISQMLPMRFPFALAHQRLRIMAAGDCRCYSWDMGPSSSSLWATAFLFYTKQLCLLLTSDNPVNPANCIADSMGSFSTQPFLFSFIWLLILGICKAYFAGVTLTVLFIGYMAFVWVLQLRSRGRGHVSGGFGLLPKCVVSGSSSCTVFAL